MGPNLMDVEKSSWTGPLPLMGLVLRAGRWHMIYFLQYERREGIFIFAHYIISHTADMIFFRFRNINQKRRKIRVAC
jgi:hypothetical protein